MILEIRVNIYCLTESAFLLVWGKSIDWFEVYFWKNGCIQEDGRIFSTLPCRKNIQIHDIVNHFPVTESIVNMLSLLWGTQSPRLGPNISDSECTSLGRGVMSPRSWCVIYLCPGNRETTHTPCGPIYLRTECIQMRSGWYCCIFLSRDIPRQNANGAIYMSHIRVNLPGFPV